MKPHPGDVRSAAAWVIDFALASRRPVDRLLRRVEPPFDARDRGLLRELTLGTLRWLRRLDHVIEAASSRSLASIDPELRSPLRISAYQILWLDRVPTHAAVSEAVNEARRRTNERGAAFVNAVLRRVAGRPALESWPVTGTDTMRRLAIETSHPDLLVRRWLRRFGEARTRRLLDVDNTPKPLHLLTFRARGSVREAAERLVADGVVTRPSTVSRRGLVVRSGDPLSTRSFRDGDIYVQDEASQAAALIPPPRAGEWVLDLAAAPGGKSFSLLAHQPRLRMVAADAELPRLRTMQSNAARLRLDLPLLLADGTRPPVRASFQRVVVDLPCSGTGTLRKHPELKWRISAKEIDRLSRRGLELVRAAARVVSSGGLLAVITCSLEDEENSGVIGRLLAERGDYQPVALENRLSPALARHVTGPGAWQLLPDDDHDGFTVHVLRRGS